MRSAASIRREIRTSPSRSSSGHARRLPVVEVDGVELVFPGLVSDVGLGGYFDQDVAEAVDLEAVPGQGPGAVMVHSG